MLRELLNEKTILLKQPAKTREEAIRKAAKPLVTLEKITENYVDEMIKALEDMGPYMVIVPGIAFAHAKPSEEVLEDCMSLMTLEEPVKFMHEKNDPVSIIFVLASSKKDRHLKGLTHISKLLNDKDFIQALKEAKDPQDIIDFF